MKSATQFAKRFAAAAIFLSLFAPLARVSAATVQVLVANGGLTFSPSSLSIQTGDTVEWVWKSSGHSSTSGTPGNPNGLWDSGLQSSGFIFSHNFPAAGSFSYYCTPHGGCCGMVGTVNVSNPVQLTSVVSRMSHGSPGIFDIVLTAGNGVECRNSASGVYQMIFAFGNALVPPTGAHPPTSATVSCGAVSSSAFGPNSNEYTVNLSGQGSCNGQYNTITLSSVEDSAGNYSATLLGPRWGLLPGDTTADGTVNSADISQTKSQSGNVVTGSNFREDVTVDGTLNSADISLVKSKSGTALP